MTALLHSFQETARITAWMASDEVIQATTIEAVRILCQTFTKGNKVLICGNGGSACDAMHFAEEFTGRYRKNRKPLPVMSFADPSHITCVANDFGFSEIFSRSVEAYGKPGDVFIGISTSGNSENVIKALRKAKVQGLVTLALLGKDGGKLAGEADLEFRIPALTSDRIQEAHMTLLHVIVEGVERSLFPENYV